MGAAAALTTVFAGGVVADLGNTVVAGAAFGALVGITGLAAVADVAVVIGFDAGKVALAALVGLTVGTGLVVGYFGASAGFYSVDSLFELIEALLIAWLRLFVGYDFGALISASFIFFKYNQIYSWLTRLF